MASIGEMTYRDFLTKLCTKASNRYIRNQDTQRIGRVFWPLMSVEFKNKQKELYGRNGFWGFAQTLRDCMIKQEIDELFSLYEHFDENGKNLFEYFYDRCLASFVSDAL